MDRILRAVVREAHERQDEETKDVPEDGHEGIYRSYLDN